MDELDKTRIVSLTMKMLEEMISRGEVDANDEEALKAAALKCAPLARSAYFAALEFISG